MYYVEESREGLSKKEKWESLKEKNSRGLCFLPFVLFCLSDLSLNVPGRHLEQF